MTKKKEKIIQVFNLLHVYKGKVETVALPGISFSVNKGERLIIRGKSGVGKTTLLTSPCFSQASVGEDILTLFSIVQQQERYLFKGKTFWNLMKTNSLIIDVIQ